VFVPESTISGYPCCEASILLHWNQNDVSERFRAFRLPSARKNMQNLCSYPNALFQGTKVVKHPFKSTGPKMTLGSVSEHFANLQAVKRCNLVFVNESTISGSKVAKHPFYFIGTKMMFGSVSEHFANLWHVKRCKTCVSHPNELFWGTQVAKHPFYSIGTKLMFGSVSEHFSYFRHVKRIKICVSGQNALFRGTKLAKHPF
jgi:hypothetical protein